MRRLSKEPHLGIRQELAGSAGRERAEGSARNAKAVSVELRAVVQQTVGLRRGH